MTTDHGEEQESAQSQIGYGECSLASADAAPSAALECLRALLALPLVQNSARPLAEPWATAERIVEAEAEPYAVAWLRDVGGPASDGEWDECWVPCAKGDPGARRFIVSGGQADG